MITKKLHAGERAKIAVYDNSQNVCINEMIPVFGIEKQYITFNALTQDSTQLKWSTGIVDVIHLHCAQGLRVPVS